MEMFWGTPKTKEEIEEGQFLCTPLIIFDKDKDDVHNLAPSSIAHSRWAVHPCTPEEQQPPPFNSKLNYEDKFYSKDFSKSRMVDFSKCRFVDEYENFNLIGKGTYGIVFRACEKKTGEVVALKKFILKNGKEHKTSVMEFQILSSIHHPSIIDVKEVVVSNGEPPTKFMVMEYIEHDLKSLMEKSMVQPFSQSEVKCLMLQLFGGVKFLHNHGIVHKDLKPSNLLLNNCGELKICDFGMAQWFGSQPLKYTHEIVTLSYRAPELLFGAKEYSIAIDMWSLGCIMAELLSRKPLFLGHSRFDQIDKICQVLGTPNTKIWPNLPNLVQKPTGMINQPFNKLREQFPSFAFIAKPTLTQKGFDLLNRLLTYDPLKRITIEEAFNHEWFQEVPLPKAKEFMPTFPSQTFQN